jgi:CRP/FNR family nitrogen fixation transcriptional regulator
MLTETLIRPAPSRSMLGGTRNAVPAGAHALASSIELMGVPMTFARNAEIYGQKEPSDCFYNVVSGTVRTYRALIDGRRQIGAFYLPGDTFGLEPGTEHAFSAEAVVDTRVQVISRSAVATLAALDKQLARQLWDLMGSELKRAQDHGLLLIKTAPERVASFLVEMAERIPASKDVELPMSRQDIADYLGLTIETVSRTLTQLENASMIALPTSKRIVLRDRAVLKQLTV